MFISKGSTSNNGGVPFLLNVVILQKEKHLDFEFSVNS